jgi:hypothetical protein
VAEGRAAYRPRTTDDGARGNGHGRTRCWEDPVRRRHVRGRPFEKRSAHLFFQLVARRYERASMLVTTNQMVGQWGGVFGDDVLAAAILDRLLHHSHTLVIQGESYRLKQKKKAGLLSGAVKS